MFWPKPFPDHSLKDRRPICSSSPSLDVDTHGCSLQDCAIMCHLVLPHMLESRPRSDGRDDNFKGSHLKQLYIYISIFCFAAAVISWVFGFWGPSSSSIHNHFCFRALLDIRRRRPPASGRSAKLLTCNKVARQRPPRSCRGYAGHRLREGTFQGKAQFAKAVRRGQRAHEFKVHPLQDMLRSLNLVSGLPITCATTTVCKIWRLWPSQHLQSD